MHLLCLIIAFYGRIYTRLWRGGYRQVVLGRRKHFGCPKTQLAIRLTLLIFLSLAYKFTYERSLFSRFTAKLLSYQVLTLYPIGCNDDSTTANYTRRGIKSVRKNSHAEYCYAELGASCLCPNPILNSDGDTRKFFWVKNYRRELFARKPVGLNL